MVIGFAEALCTKTIVINPKTRSQDMQCIKQVIKSIVLLS